MIPPTLVDYRISRQEYSLQQPSFSLDVMPSANSFINMTQADLNADPKNFKYAAHKALVTQSQMTFLSERNVFLEYQAARQRSADRETTQTRHAYRSDASLFDSVARVARMTKEEELYLRFLAGSDKGAAERHLPFVSGFRRIVDNHDEMGRSEHRALYLEGAVVIPYSTDSEDDEME
jgi:hypothetical protein